VFVPQMPIKVVPTCLLKTIRWPTKGIFTRFMGAEKAWELVFHMDSSSVAIQVFEVEEANIMVEAVSSRAFVGFCMILPMFAGLC
jgi:hypothetical protein